MSGLTVRHDGEQIRISDEDGNELLVPPEPRDWQGSRADWIVVYLQNDGADVTARAQRAIRAALETDGQAPALVEIADPDLGRLLRRIGSDLLALEDADALLVALATAVSVADADHEPLWLVLVGAASTGKDETLGLLGQVADGRLSGITPEVLLSGRAPKGGEPRRTGLLADLGDHCNALVTVSDLPSVLEGGSAAALRDVYDGGYTRTTDRASLSWEGRVTLLGGASPAIDAFGAQTEPLGSRCVLFRLPAFTDEQRDAVQAMIAGRTNASEVRADLSRQVQAIVETARARLGSVELQADTRTLVSQVAGIAGYGRATVPRDVAGDPQDAAHWEEPARLTQQLLGLARALSALEVGDVAVRRIVRRAALSCIPAARAWALDALEADEWTTTQQAAKTAGLDDRVTRRALADWLATRRVVETRRGEKADQPDGAGEPSAGPEEWRIAPKNAANVAAILGR